MACSGSKSLAWLAEAETRPRGRLDSGEDEEMLWANCDRGWRIVGKKEGEEEEEEDEEKRRRRVTGKD